MTVNMLPDKQFTMSHITIKNRKQNLVTATLIFYPSSQNKKTFWWIMYSTVSVCDLVHSKAPFVIASRESKPLALGVLEIVTSSLTVLSYHPTLSGVLPSLLLERDMRLWGGRLQLCEHSDGFWDPRNHLWLCAGNPNHKMFCWWSPLHSHSFVLPL